MLVCVRDVRLWTPRLLLREHAESDAFSVSVYAADPAVGWYRSEAGCPLAAEQVRRSLAGIRAQRDEQPTRRRYDLAIVRREDEILIGWLPLSRRDNNEAEIGWLVAPAFQKQGYATEAAEAALRFAFEVLAVRHVVARCWQENRASVRIMDKLGMTSAGNTPPTGEWVEGRWVSTTVAHLSAERWRRLMRPITYEET